MKPFQSCGRKRKRAAVMQTQKEQEDMVFTTTQLLHLDSISDSSAAATMLGMYCCLLMSHDTRKTVIGVNPLEPHFYVENLGLQGYTYFSYFCSKT